MLLLTVMIETPSLPIRVGDTVTISLSTTFLLLKSERITVAPPSIMYLLKPNSFVILSNILLSHLSPTIVNSYRF